MEFCCQNFLNGINNIGQSGFSFPVAIHKDEFYFLIQSRNIDDPQYPEQVETNLVSLQTGIKFCPFCGEDLDNWLKSNKEKAGILLLKSHKYWIQKG